jgi:hypothetical protein
VLKIDLSGDDAFVTNYVHDVPGFTFPDNLALDAQGNLFITEDGDPPPGNDIWVARAGQGGAIERFASLADCAAEPTGLYFDNGSHVLYVHVQHAGAGGGDCRSADPAGEVGQDKAGSGEARWLVGAARPLRHLQASQHAIWSHDIPLVALLHRGSRRISCLQRFEWSLLHVVWAMRRRFVARRGRPAEGGARPGHL